MLVTRSNNLPDRGSFSYDDIEILRTARILKQDFITFADCRNKRYALVISDVAKAKAFFDSHDYREIEVLYSASQTGNDTQEMDERRIKNVIGTLSANGIGFYVSNDASNFQSWTLLNP